MISFSCSCVGHLLIIDIVSNEVSINNDKSAKIRKKCFLIAGFYTNIWGMINYKWFTNNIGGLILMSMAALRKTQ